MEESIKVEKEVDGLVVFVMHKVEVTESMDPERVFLPCVVESVSLLEQLENGMMTVMEREVSLSVVRNLSKRTDRMERDSVLEVERTTRLGIMELSSSWCVIHEHL